MQHKGMRISAVLFGLVALTGVSARAGDSPFPNNVVVQGANPDFVLEDTDGEDWAIEADEPVANAFSIARNGGGVANFVIEDGAAANSLYIEASGEIGIGTSNPMGDLNITDVNNSGTAGIRFIETAGTAQTWDLTAGSSSFSIRDDTNNRTRVRFDTSGSSFFTMGNSVFLSTGAGTSLTLDSSGASLTGSLVQLSSRESKDDIRPVEPRRVLERVLELPVAEWRYKTEEESVRHLGPMAEDFHAAFGLGADDTGIPVLDASGVALAAIQGLKAEQDERLAEQEGRLAEQERLTTEKDREIDELRQELDRLRRMVLEITGP